MSTSRHHAEWLSLVPVSGPFLSLPVLLKAFPQGLDAHDSEHAASLRMAYEDWNEGTVASDAGRVAGNQSRHERRTTRPDPHASQHAWIRFVLTQTLEFDETLLLEGPAIPQTLQAELPEHHEFLRPNYVLRLDDQRLVVNMHAIFAGSVRCIRFDDGPEPSLTWLDDYYNPHSFELAFSLSLSLIVNEGTGEVVEFEVENINVNCDSDSQSHSESW